MQQWGLKFAAVLSTIGQRNDGPRLGVKDTSQLRTAIQHPEGHHDAHQIHNNDGAW